jgi:hypothetical protein
VYTTSSALSRSSSYMPEMTIATATGSLSLGYCNKKGEKGEKKEVYKKHYGQKPINNDHMICSEK